MKVSSYENLIQRFRLRITNKNYKYKIKLAFIHYVRKHNNNPVEKIVILAYLTYFEYTPNQSCFTLPKMHLYSFQSSKMPRAFTSHFTFFNEPKIRTQPSIVLTLISENTLEKDLLDFCFDIY